MDQVRDHLRAVGLQPTSLDRTGPLQPSRKAKVARHGGSPRRRSTRPTPGMTTIVARPTANAQGFYAP
jgi:hypothetical protein